MEISLNQRIRKFTSARKISSIESIPFSRTQERSLSQKMSLLEAQFPATVSHAANYPACATPMHCSPRQPEAGSSSLFRQQFSSQQRHPGPSPAQKRS